MKTYYISKEITKIEVYEVKAKNCDEAKIMIDEDENNGKLVHSKLNKKFLNVSGLYKL